MQNGQSINIDSISTELTKGIMTVNDIMKRINGENNELRGMVEVLKKEIGEDKFKELFPDLVE